MRSVIIFALLALAMCQNPLFDAMTGFNTKLGVSGNDNGNNCLIGLMTELQQAGPLYQDYITENLVALLADASTFAQGFEPAVQAACEPFGQDLENYAITFGNGNEPRANALLNFPYVAQQAATLFVNVNQQDFTAVGETLAYIFQIVIGAVDLESLLPTPLTYEQKVTIQQNVQSLLTNPEALTQYLQAFVEGYGVADSVNVDALVQLTTQTEGLLAAVMTLEAQLESGDFDAAITAIETFITTVLEVVRNNKEGLQSIAVIDGPVLEAFAKNPAQVIAMIVFNTAINYPELMQLDTQIQQEILDGDFAAYGTTAAQLTNIIYANIVQN